MNKFFSFLVICLFTTIPVWACNHLAHDVDRPNAESKQEVHSECADNDQKMDGYPIRLNIRFVDTNDSIIIFSKSIPTVLFQNNPDSIKFHKTHFSDLVDHSYNLSGDAVFNVGGTTFKKTSAGIVMGDRSFPSSSSLGFTMSAEGRLEQIYPDPTLKDAVKISPDVSLYFSDVVYLVIVKNAELKDVHFDKPVRKKQKNKFMTLEGETSLTVFGVSVRSQGGKFYVNDQLVPDHQRVVIQNTGTYKIGSQ